MSFDSDRPRPRGPLAWSVKMTLILGLGATALAHHIARPVDTPATARQQSARHAGDPEVTGSIGARALATRLDPCALSGPLRAGARD